MFDSFGEVMQLIAVEDTVAVFGREASACLFHPVDGRETGNDEGMVMRDLLNGAQHRSGFAGLSKRHCQNTINAGHLKCGGDLFTELYLIGKHIVP